MSENSGGRVAPDKQVGGRPDFTSVSFKIVSLGLPIPTPFKEELVRKRKRAMFRAWEDGRHHVNVLAFMIEVRRVEMQKDLNRSLFAAWAPELKKSILEDLPFTK